MSAAFRLCAVVPSYNHHRETDRIVAALQSHGLQIFIIDDGSDPSTRAVLAALADRAGGIEVHRLEPNRGKGGAVSHGLKLAAEAGFTHALQIDADGQHDLAALPDLIRLARQYPTALITGVPIYDETVPLGRAIGRHITHFWVYIETLSLQISDSMCGFRIYPLAPAVALLTSRTRIGQRMDFDTEIMVRLFWRGVSVVELPVRVVYPEGNASNFRMFRDNMHISWMHTRLFFTMLAHLPAVLANRPARLAPARHWAKLAERGARWGLNIWALAYRIFGRRGCLIAMAPVVMYFYLTGREQRRASRDFLSRVALANGVGKPGFWSGYRHFLSFAGKGVDSFAAWVGGIPAELVKPVQVADLRALERDPRGALLVVSHLGNADLARALLDQQTRERLIILVHTQHAENFNRLLREARPEAALNCRQVTELGPEAAIELKSAVEQGKWLVIAGDRVPVGSRGRISRLPFLGAAANFSHGPYILGALLDCPVLTLFCVREDGHYALYAEKLADRIVLPRSDRDGALARYAATFAGRLARFARQHPSQWYNFFDFWDSQQGGAKP